MNRELCCRGHDLHDRFTQHVQDVFDKRASHNRPVSTLSEQVPLSDFRERFEKPSSHSETPFDDLIDRNPELALFRDVEEECAPVIGLDLSNQGLQEEVMSWECPGFEVGQQRDVVSREEIQEGKSRSRGDVPWEY